jgi:hypothetical protein
MTLSKTFNIVFILYFVLASITCEKNEDQKAMNVDTKQPVSIQVKTDWEKTFSVEPKNFISTGINDYFILKPGYQLTLQGKADGKDLELIITVLDETKIVDGVETRIVEERESKAGKLIEVSYNYFALDKTSNNIYYFGETVDIYKHDKIVSHEGAWESGKNGAKFGLMIPGKINIGKKFYQEIAPEVAMDRAEIISNSETLETPARKFERCLKIEETTPLEPGVKGYKIYGSGVGLIKDGSLSLIKYGFKK